VSAKPVKPLGHRVYGSIPHLPGSRIGPADEGIELGQANIATRRARDKNDLVIVQEKLDGSNVAVANINGELVALMRAGYMARDSHHEQHRRFAEWAAGRPGRFDWLRPGERLVGEWLAMAHGTLYNLAGRAPFVAFDIMRNGHERATWREFVQRAAPNIAVVPTLHVGAPLPVDDALALVGEHGHYGAIDRAEGAVWRVERRGVVDFLAKFVRPDKVDGRYFGDEPLWQWPCEESFTRA